MIGILAVQLAEITLIKPVMGFKIKAIYLKICIAFNVCTLITWKSRSSWKDLNRGKIMKKIHAHNK